MSAPATLTRPPATFARAAASWRREKEPERKFGGIFDEYPDSQHAEVQAAIDLLLAERKAKPCKQNEITKPHVREIIDGVWPGLQGNATQVYTISSIEDFTRSKRPPAIAPVVETVYAPPDFDEAAQMAKTADQMTAAARVRKSDFRARVAHAESLIASGADIEISRPYLTVDGWGSSPRANRYESEDTWRFRLAELFAPTGGCGG